MTEEKQKSLDIILKNSDAIFKIAKRKFDGCKMDAADIKAVDVHKEAIYRELNKFTDVDISKVKGTGQSYTPETHAAVNAAIWASIDAEYICGHESQMSERLKEYQREQTIEEQDFELAR